MAYRRRFRRFRRSYSRGRRFAGSRQGGLMFTLAGGVAGYMAPVIIPQQDMLINILAVLPVKMPRMIRRLAGGYVLGRIGKQFMGTNNPGDPGSGVV